VRKKLWGGRDLPFLVALDGGGPTPIAGSDRTAKGATTAAYGITGFPTTILIDRKGKLAGKFNASHEPHIRKLREMLGLAAELPRTSQASGTHRDKTGWRKRFHEVYRLSPGQVLKRIAPPFIPERLTYSREEDGRSKPPTYYRFPWDGALGSPGFGFVSAMPLTRALTIVGLARNEYEGPAELLELDLPGDWIVREGVRREALLRRLAEIVRDGTDRSIRFELRPVERNVVVVRGTYKARPLTGIAMYDDRAVHIVADELDPDESAGGGTGTLVEFLRWVGNRLNCWVVNETDSPADMEIVWANHRSSKLRKLPEGDEKAAKLAQVLANLSRQTSLKFTPERRKVAIWFVAEAK